MTLKTVETADGSLTVLDPACQETYHSSMGARLEAEKLYIQASGFSKALSTPGRKVIRVLDVGLGLAYNAISTLEAWLNSPDPGNLQLLSLEYNEELIQAITNDAPWASNWPESWKKWCSKLCKTSDGIWQMNLTHDNGSKSEWVIQLGDALKGHLFQNFSLNYETTFDFIWQDPFSPQKNPKMWSGPWFEKLYSCSHSKTVLATYSVARVVRDGLESSKWTYQKIETLMTHKRHWLLASPLTN